MWRWKALKALNITSATLLKAAVQDASLPNLETFLQLAGDAVVGQAFVDSLIAKLEAPAAAAAPFYHNYGSYNYRRVDFDQAVAACRLLGRYELSGAVQLLAVACAEHPHRALDAVRLSVELKLSGTALLLDKALATQRDAQRAMEWIPFIHEVVLLAASCLFLLVSSCLVVCLLVAYCARLQLEGAACTHQRCASLVANRFEQVQAQLQRAVVRACPGSRGFVKCVTCSFCDDTVKHHKPSV